MRTREDIMNGDDGEHDSRRVTPDQLHKVLTSGILTESMRRYVETKQQIAVEPSSRTPEVQQEISGFHHDIATSASDLSRDESLPVYTDTEGSRSRVRSPLTLGVMGREAMHSAVEIEQQLDQQYEEVTSSTEAAPPIDPNQLAETQQRTE